MKSKILKIIEDKHKISAGHNGVYVSDLMIELDCKYSDIKGVLNQLYTDNQIQLKEGIHGNLIFKKQK